MNEFIKRIISRLLYNLVREKIGCEIDIKLNNIYVKSADNKNYVNINADLSFEEKEINNIIKKLLEKGEKQ